MTNNIQDRTLVSLDAELGKARRKFPSAGNFMLSALVEEVGELAEALMQNGNNGADHSNVRKEAIQVAAMAIRIVEEGDGTHAYVPESVS